MRSLMRSLATNFSVAVEFLMFLLRRKSWWLIPFVFLLLLLGLFMGFAATSGVGPFIYTMF